MPFRSGYYEGVGDYFNRTKAAQRLRSGRESPKSPMWPRLPSAQASPSLPSASASSVSSRAGSWSSLFTTNTMRQFMADKLTGVQDSLKDGLMTPSAEKTPPLSRRSSAIPIPRREPDSPRPTQRKSTGNDSLSWNEDKRRASTVSFSPAKSLVSTLTATSHLGAPKKQIVFQEAMIAEESSVAQHPFHIVAILKVVLDCLCLSIEARSTCTCDTSTSTLRSSSDGSCTTSGWSCSRSYIHMS